LIDVSSEMALKTGRRDCAEIRLQLLLTIPQHLEPDGVLVLYSDGAVERRHGDEEFGLPRLEEVVIRNRQESAPAILDRIYQAVTAFGDPLAFEDDVTVVVIKKSPLDS
jgi:sigma-B regulation protein RsbU (phosphoserine phosphatase)